MKKIKLSSGAELIVQPAPFLDAKNLYQSMLKELSNIDLNQNVDVIQLYKDLFCRGFSSPEIEQNIWVCLGRCTYDNGKLGPLKIDQDTFEPVEARQDYMSVCIEVVKENVLPFAKTLFADYGEFSQMIVNVQK